MLSQTEKYTAMLPRDCLQELRNMADEKIIASVNQGIRAAIEDFVRAHKERGYKHSMREAATVAAPLALSFASVSLGYCSIE